MSTATLTLQRGWYFQHDGQVAYVAIQIGDRWYGRAGGGYAASWDKHGVPSISHKWEWYLTEFAGDGKYPPVNPNNTYRPERVCIEGDLN